MLPQEVEKLKRQYTDQYVVVQAGRPELARFKGLVGQVKTVNMSERALVEFDADNNHGWFDIEPALLTIVDKPPPKPVEKPEKKAAAAKPKPAAKTPPMARAGDPVTIAPAPTRPSRAERRKQVRALMTVRTTPPSSRPIVSSRKNNAGPNLLAVCSFTCSGPVESLRASP